MASVVDGFGRRLLAASVPVAAVAYAWSSIETGPSARVFVGVAALAVPSALPSRLVVRAAVAVATLARADARCRGNERRGRAGRRRPGAEGHLRRRAPVRPEDPPRAACARDPHRLRVLPRDRGHRRQPAVPRGSVRGGRDRLARHDPPGPEHDRDGRAGASRGALADRDQRPPRPPRPRPRGRGQPRHRGRRRRCSPAPVHAPPSPRSTGRTGTCSARAGRGTRSWPCGAPTTAASTFRPARPPCSRSRRPAARSTGGRPRSTPSPRITGSRRSTRPAPAGQNRVLPADPLLPAAASSRAGWVKQEVDVQALVDDHVIAAGQPMEIDGIGDTGIRSLSGGVMLTPGGLAGMRRYTVWSYAPAPSPAALVRSPPAYPTLARPLSRRRPHRRAGLRRPRAGCRGVEHLPRRPLPAAVGVRADVDRGLDGSRPRRARRTRRRS